MGTKRSTTESQTQGSWIGPRRRGVLLGAAGVAATSLVGGDALAAAPSGQPIKIGWIGPLSPPGGYAEGILMKDGAGMAEEEINARGGILGRPIKIVYVDARGLPQAGAAGAERLIVDDHAVAIFGTFSTTVAIPIVQGGS